jgi:D-glycero-beta-D-manno-heptose 1-phosphate adenylyltransferase
VLTSGSFDLVHLGHVKYLAKAKELGDVLIVGVDGDAKIRRRKGEDRPMVPEAERLEMLAHQRPVDVIYLKADDEERWALIETVRPDVLVLSADHSYDAAEQEQLREICGDLQVLERQAAVTTSERIRQLYMHLGERLGPKLAEVLPGLIDTILKRE